MEEKGKSNSHRACALAVSLIVASWVVLLYIRIVLPGEAWSQRKSLTSQTQTSAISTPPDKPKNTTDPCTGKYIFVYKLDPKFNDEMIKDCARATSVWVNKCKDISVNSGMGPPLEGMLSSGGWFATNPYALDAIFFNRMKRYECLTDDPSAATAFFVPFYGGFDIGRYIWGYNTSMRDAASLELFEWLARRPEWGIMGGRDHFMVAGRMASDFRRGTDKDSDWGNKLLTLPGAKNMTILLVESSPWGSNDFAVPWPTYFHPAKDLDVSEWQARIRNSDRNWMFSFVGAARPGNPNSIRSKIIDQCRNSHNCKLLECDRSENSECYSPQSVMRTFQSSIFCVQPPGDTLTRRSIFDALLAGCIPVLFHPGSAYTQYTWHLPEDYASYSVFIPEDDFRTGNVSIESTLARIPHDMVDAMRENVVRLVPRIVYADPRGQLETVRDAFDVAVEAVIDKVRSSRAGEGKRWKYVVSDQGRKKKKGGRDWDRFFLGQ